MYTNKNFIKLITVTIMFMFILSGCGGPKPDAVVTSFLTALQETDYETASTYIAKTNSDEQESESFDLEFEDEMQKQLLNSIMKNIQFENVVTESTEGEKASVKISLTTLDCVTIMNNVMSQAMGLAFSYAFSDTTDQEGIEKMIETLLANAFSSPDAPKTQKDITINLTKTNNGWKIIADESLMDGLTGGLLSAFSAF